MGANFCFLCSYIIKILDEQEWEQGNLYDLNSLSAIFQYFHVSNQLTWDSLLKVIYLFFLFIL